MDKKLVLREKLNEIAPYLGEEDIIIVLGARRVGKTTLLSQMRNFLIQERGVKEQNIYFLNLDVVDDLLIVKDQSSFIKYIKSRIANKEKLYFFIDEVQRLENPGLFLKGVYDLHLPIQCIVSGSSSLEIKAKTQEQLTGRKKLFYLYPFSFGEFLSAKDEEFRIIQQKGEMSEADTKIVRQYLKEFLVWGGYPEVVLADTVERKMRALEEIYNSYLDKDIVNFLKIEDQIAFTKLVKILSSQAGGLANVSELSMTLGVKNTTVKRYLQALEGTFVVKLIPPFFKNTRKETTKMPKVYFIDNGVRNFALKHFEEFDDREDKGQLLENYIFSVLLKELRTFDSIFFWRTKDKAEVDFVVETDTLLPVEVKAWEMHKPVFPRALLSFSLDYAVRDSIVVNLLFQGIATKNGTHIHYMTPEQFTVRERYFISQHH